MSTEARIVAGAPSAEEAAAVLAAVQLILDETSGIAPQAPWPYRSAWRRAAIDDGVRRAEWSPDVS